MGLLASTGGAQFAIVGLLHALLDVGERFARGASQRDDLVHSWRERAQIFVVNAGLGRVKAVRVLAELVKQADVRVGMLFLKRLAHAGERRVLLLTEAEHLHRLLR